MSGLPQDAKFLSHIQDPYPEARYEVSLEWQDARFGYPAIDETVFVRGEQWARYDQEVCQEEKEKEKEKRGEEKEKHPPSAPSGQLPPQGREEKSFLRIFNVGSYFPSSQATLTLTPEEYKAAQHLGLTKNLDQSLTARVIGELGEFRYVARRDAVLFDVLDDVHLEEEAICQTIFERVEALQAIERAHGGTPEELRTALTEYKTKFLEPEIKKLQDIDPRNVHQKLLLESYQRDLAQTRALLAAASEAKADAQGDVLRNETEDFIRSRLNEALVHGRKTDELITIGSRINPFRSGAFTTASTKAAKLIRDYHFDQECRITKAHQGDHSDARTERIVLTSFHTTSGSQRDTLERFTFTAALIFSPEDSLSHQNTKDRPTWSIPGWAKVWKRLRNLFSRTRVNDTAQAIESRYKAYKGAAKGANISAWKAGLQDLGNLLYDGGKALLVSFASAGSSLFEALTKLRLDFTDLSKKPLPKPQPEASPSAQEIMDTAKWNSMSFREQVVYVFHHIEERLERDRGVYRKTDQKVEEKKQDKPTAPAAQLEKKALTEDEKKAKQARMNKILTEFHEKYKHLRPQEGKDRKAAKPPKVTDIAALAIPPSLLSGDLREKDILSIGMGGLESFYAFFDLFHDQNPAISVYAMALYWLTTACMAAPAAVTAAGDKMHVPMEAFIQFNNAAGAAMAKGQFSGIVAQNFTMWQAAIGTGEALTGGEDSLIGAGADLTRKHFIEVVTAVFAIYGVGVLLTDLFTPLEEELGNMPQFVQFFTGLKAVLAGYEGFESAPHEHSIIGSLLFDLIDFLVCAAIRAPLSIVNFFYMAVIRKPYQYFRGQEVEPINWPNVIGPWAELLHKGIAAFLRTFDFLLRLLNLIGSILRMFTKALVDWSIGLLVFTAKALPILIMFAVPLFWPLVYLIRKEIGQTLRGVKDDTQAFLSSPGAIFRRMLIEKATKMLAEHVMEQGRQVLEAEGKSIAPADTPQPQKKAEAGAAEEDIGFWKKTALKVWRCELTPLPEWLIRFKFALFFVGNGFKEKMQYGYHALRNLNIRYLNRPESHIDHRIRNWLEIHVMGRTQLQLADAELAIQAPEAGSRPGAESLRRKQGSTGSVIRRSSSPSKSPSDGKTSSPSSLSSSAPP